MAEDNTAHDPIPEHFATLEEAAEFWDTHDLADYWSMTELVDADIDLQQRVYSVALDLELADKLLHEARRKGVTVDALIQAWLHEKIHATGCE